MPDSIAAFAVRTLALVATFIPKKPARIEKAGTQQKADAGSPADEESDQEEKNSNKNSKNLVLRHQKGVGALRDGRGNFLHTGSSGRSLGNIVCLIGSKAQRTDGQNGDQPE